MALRVAGGGGGSGTAGTLGPSITYAAPAGASNNVNPAGFSSTVNRVGFTLAAGTSNFTGFIAGTDGQEVVFSNQDSTNNLTLNNRNAGSSAANRFIFVGDLVLTPGDSIRGVYWSSGALGAGWYIE